MLIWTRVKQAIGRVPKVGDPVWWATKQVGLIIKEVGPSRYVAVGGPVGRAKRSGKLVQRWTLTALHRNTIWDDRRKMWIVGEGPYPPFDPRAQVVTPKPVTVDADVIKQIVREES